MCGGDDGFGEEVRLAWLGSEDCKSYGSDWGGDDDCVLNLISSDVKSHICKWSHGIILVHTFEVHILREV